MQTFLYFISKEWMHIWRDKRTLFILFGMPIAQMLIFGFALTNEVKNSRIAILDPSKDQYSTRLVERISASNYFDLQDNLHNPVDIDKAFKKGDIRAAIIFPEHFMDKLLHSKSVTIQIIADASDPNIATTVTNYANAIIRDFQDDLLNNPSYPYTIQANVRMLYNPQLKGAFNFVPGVMSMILLLVCTMMTSVSIVREKELGTMEVLLASPSSPGLVIAAKALPYLFLSIINICTILLLSVFVLELPIRGNLILLMAESILFIITALSLGLLISIITDSQRTAMFISLVGMFLPTLMLSGFMFPIENMPKPLQIISNIVPAKWFFIIVKAVMLKGLGLAAIWKETLILFGMTAFLLLVAMKKFKIRL